MPNPIPFSEFKIHGVTLETAIHMHRTRMRKQWEFNTGLKPLRGSFNRRRLQKRVRQMLDMFSDDFRELYNYPELIISTYNQRYKEYVKAYERASRVDNENGRDRLPDSEPHR